MFRLFLFISSPVCKGFRSIVNNPTCTFSRAVRPSAIIRNTTTMATPPDNQDCHVLLTTSPNMDIAKKISHGLVENKHAACVNIIPQVTSIYEWEGKVQEDEELLMVIKSTGQQLDKVVSYIQSNHPYDVPEVISMKIEYGSKAYLDWIRKITGSKV